MDTRPLPVSRQFESVTRRWWFYLILLAVFFIPIYAERGYDPQNTPKVVMEVLAHALVYSAAWSFPLFKLLPAVLLLPLVFGRVRFSRLFLGYAGINLLIMAIFQAIAKTPSYGWVVMPGNLVIFTLVGAAWIWSAVRGDPVVFKKQRWWRYWVIPAALLAFWFPVDTSLATPGPDFSLAKLASNEAGLTLCMMLPVYLSALICCMPGANPVVLRVSAFAGLVTGLLNVTQFFLNPGYGWWLGVVHLPLLLISAYALRLGFQKTAITSQAGAHEPVPQS